MQRNEPSFAERCPFQKLESMAFAVLVALPIIVLFFFTQKTFIEGISMTGIKG